MKVYTVTLYHHTMIELYAIWVNPRTAARMIYTELPDWNLPETLDGYKSNAVDRQDGKPTRWEFWTASIPGTVMIEEVEVQ